MRQEGIHFLQRLRAGARHTQYLLCSTPLEITTAAAASTSTGSARSSVLRLCRDHRGQRDLSAYAAANMLQIRLCAIPQPSSSTGGQQHGPNSNCNLVASYNGRSTSNLNQAAYELACYGRGSSTDQIGPLTHGSRAQHIQRPSATQDYAQHTGNMGHALGTFSDRRFFASKAAAPKPAAPAPPLPPPPPAAAESASGSAAAGSGQSAAAAAAAGAATAQAAGAAVNASAAWLRWLLSGRMASSAVRHVSVLQQSHPWLYNTGALGVTSLGTWYLLDALLHGLAAVGIPGAANVEGSHLVAFSLASSAAAGSYLHWLHAASPAAVVQHALRALNAHPGVTEVMGSPITAADIHACITTAGGLHMAHASSAPWPHRRPARVHVSFPVVGSESTGVVMGEATRQQGTYEWQVLAVDVGGGAARGKTAAAAAAVSSPPALQAGHVIMVAGDGARLAAGSVLHSLSQPLQQVCALRESYEVEAEVQAEIAALSLKQARASGTLPPGPIRILLALSGTLASKLGTALKSLPAKARVLLGPKEVSGTAAPGTGNTPTTSSSTGVSK